MQRLMQSRVLRAWGTFPPLVLVGIACTVAIATLNFWAMLYFVGGACTAAVIMWLDLDPNVHARAVGKIRNQGMANALGAHNIIALGVFVSGLLWPVMLPLAIRDVVRYRRVLRTVPKRRRKRGERRA